MRYILHSLILLVLVFSIGGCGGSGGSGGGAPIGASSGASPSVSFGEITGFGSIFVNGVEYFLSIGTQVFLDDALLSEADLRKGMLVKVSGSKNNGAPTGSAITIIFNDIVEGPISQIDLNSNSLVVLGKTIFVDANTIIKDRVNDRFDDADDNINPRLNLSDLSIGDYVEVSGLITNAGHILASRIERKPIVFIPNVTIVEVKGIVSNHSGLNKTFNLGTLFVDYSTATQVEGNIANNVFVEAKGTLNAAWTILTAQKVEEEDGLFDNTTNESIEIEGVVTSFTSPTSFSINSVPVDASMAVFEGGAPDDVALNVRLEAEGFFSNKVLLAEKIKFKSNQIKIDAHVQGAPQANSIKALGLMVHFNGLTEIKNGPLSNNDPIEIRGFVSNGEINAVEMKKVNEVKPDEFILQGPVDNNSITPPSSFSILSITIDVTNATFENHLGDPISRNVFFNLLAAGALVKAKGAYNGTDTLFAKEVDLED